MAGLTGTQALLIVLIILVFFLVFRRSERRPRPDYPWRPRPGWWPEHRAIRDREYDGRR